MLGIEEERDVEFRERGRALTRRFDLDVEISSMDIRIQKSSLALDEI
jgi:hypothetical protein